MSESTPARNGDDPPADDASGSNNPYAPPADTEMPVIETHGKSDSPLVRRLRKSTGNDLVYCALIVTIAAYFIPFGVLLDGLSLFLLLRVILTRSKPSTWCVVLGIIICLWNLFRVAAILLVIAITILLN